MIVELTGLATVNVAYFVVGAAACVAAGWVDDRPETWYRFGAAYLLGIVIVVVPASYLALVRVPVGVGAAATGAVVIGAGVWRGRRLRPRRPRSPRPTADGVVAAVLAVVAAVVLIHASRTLVTRPLVEYDAWAIWAAKARLLYEAAGDAPAALRTGRYGQAPYPLGLPTLQALGFGGMGRFDGTLIGAQFVALAFGFVAALWSVLHRRARASVTLLAALAVVAAPQILYQLATHYADVPLGLWVGAGVAAAAAWAARPDADGWLLACAVAFLGMAALTKSEGQLFALAAAVALVVSAAGAGWPTRIRPALVAAGATVAVFLPWRLYCGAYGLTSPDYDLANVASPLYLDAHSDRVGPVFHELWRQLDAPKKWGWIVFAVAFAVVASLAGRRFRVAAFAIVWIALAFGGLVLVYWISTLPTESNLTNSSYRTIVSLLVGGAALTPLLVAPLDRPPRRRE